MVLLRRHHAKDHLGQRVEGGLPCVVPVQIEGDAVDARLQRAWGQEIPNPAIVVARLEGLWYVAAGLIGIAVSLGLTIRRYQRIST